MARENKTYRRAGGYSADNGGRGRLVYFWPSNDGENFSFGPSTTKAERAANTQQHVAC